MDHQAKSGLRLPVLAAVDRSASYAPVTGDGVTPSLGAQDLQQILGGIVQTLVPVIGAFL